MTPLVFIILVIAPTVFSSGHLDVLYQWKTVDFEFPSQSARESSIQNEEFIPGTNSVPLDVDVWHNGKINKGSQKSNNWKPQSWRIHFRDIHRESQENLVTNLKIIFMGPTSSDKEEDKTEENDRTIFLTLPKFRRGVPASLVTVSNNKRGDSYLLKPYPDWSWHPSNSCEGMTSVFRTTIDKCGRIWAVDSGMVDLSLETSRRQCQPKVLAFHLNTQRLAGSHAFPNNLLRENSILTNIVVDVRDASDQCQDTFAYVSDTAGYSLLVFDAKRNKSWRVVSNSMYPYPPYGFYRVDNVEFDLMDGIIGLALGPLENGDRTLYYHPLSSVRESWVKTSIIRNQDNFTPLVNLAARQFKTSEEARKSQSVSEAFDKNGVMYFGVVGDNTINCWNHRKPYTKDNIFQIARDNTTLQFASGLKVIKNEDDEEEIWILTSRFQLVMSGGMRQREVNFRVIRGKVEELTRGSRCVTQNSINYPNRTISNTNKPYVRPVTSGYGRFN